MKELKEQIKLFGIVITSLTIITIISYFSTCVVPGVDGDLGNGTIFLLFVFIYTSATIVIADAINEYKEYKEHKK